MNENREKYIKFIKDNFSLIILFPTVVGGLWQLIELAFITPYYIRFFSISQVIQDGLLVLFFIGCIIASFYITIFIFKFSHFYKSQLEKWRDTIGITLILIGIFTVPNIYMYFGIVERGYVEISDIFTCIGSITFVFSSFFCLLPKKVKDNFEKSSEKKSQTKIKTTTENEKPTLKNYLIGFGFLIILILTLFLFSLTTDIIGKIRNDSINTDLLINIDRLKNKLIENNSLKFNQILYFNDKYIFVEFHDSLNNRAIEVIKTEKLFE